MIDVLGFERLSVLQPLTPNPRHLLRRSRSSQIYLDFSSVFVICLVSFLLLLAIMSHQLVALSVSSHCQRFQKLFFIPWVGVSCFKCAARICSNMIMDPSQSEKKATMFCAILNADFKLATNPSIFCQISCHTLLCHAKHILLCWCCHKKKIKNGVSKVTFCLRGHSRSQQALKNALKSEVINSTTHDPITDHHCLLQRFIMQVVAQDFGARTFSHLTAFFSLLFHNICGIK